MNIAARVSAFARGGEIVCTERIAAIASEQGIAAARTMGTVRLKNVAQPVALYELNSHEKAQELRHVDPVCRMQVLPADAATRIEHEGSTFYFCSRGCADKFSQAPDVHVPVV